MKELILECASRLGVELTPDRADMLIKYYEILTETNKTMNLTRITEPREVVLKHFADSLTLLEYVEIPKNSTIIDVGTGAGFPGIPLKIARPDINLTLLDSLNKRLGFLGEVCSELGIEAKLVHSRAEDGGKDKLYREKYDFAVSRAVARLNILSEYCLPYVKVGGSFIAMKGPSEDISLGENAIKVLGGSLENVHDYELFDEKRRIAVVKKISQTPSKYPRNSSQIKKKTL